MNFPSLPLFTRLSFAPLPCLLSPSQSVSTRDESSSGLVIKGIGFIDGYISRRTRERESAELYRNRMLCISIDGKENADTDAVGGGDGRKHAQLVDFRGRLALPEPPVRDYTLTSIFFFFLKQEERNDGKQHVALVEGARGEAFKRPIVARKREKIKEEGRRVTSSFERALFLSTKRKKNFLEMN